MMKRLKRSFWAKAAVAVASIAIAIGVIGGISFASNNQPFLGDCIEYGIVCNYLNQTADMETSCRRVEIPWDALCSSKGKCER